MSVVTINPDKTIIIDGKKTFPVMMSHLCSYTRPIPSCDTDILKNNNTNMTTTTYNADPVIMRAAADKKLAAGIYSLYATDPGLIELDNHPGLIGFMQWDEPTLGAGHFKNTSTEAAMINLLKSFYAKRKASHPDKFVYQNHWEKMTKWLDCGDIMAWDTYTILQQGARTWISWPRDDSIYAWELQSWDAYFQGTELNQINKPVWTHIQANGVADTTWAGLVPTEKEIRCLTYTALTLDVKGISFWGYNMLGDWTNTSTSKGLINNPSLNQYVNQIMGELTDLNNVLVSPTLDYSWTHHPGKGMVLFSTTLTKTIPRWNKPQINFNYILKPGYLIIVNKDTRSIAANITVSGLTKNSIKTIGSETTGSGKAGRTIAVTSGVFIDTFDGYAVHIYQISDESECLPSQCDFTITQ